VHCMFGGCSRLEALIGKNNAGAEVRPKRRAREPCFQAREGDLPCRKMSEIWTPSTADELERAVDTGAIVETHRQEFKRFGISEKSGRPQIPGSVARSLAGLAVDGGVLVLGVSELKEQHRYECVPQPLAGLAEAVDQIALTAVSPSLRVSIRALVREPGNGYLVVIVPASPRAPHMVDGSYYGRGESTSRRLPDLEVRQLWQRHLDRRSDGLDLIKREVEREPLAENLRINARLFAAAQPLSADPHLLLDSVENRDLLRWVQGLNGTRLYSRPRTYAPTFASEGTSQRRAHGVARSSYYMDSDRTVRVEDGQHPKQSRILDLEYREDGGVRLYYGRASDGHPNQSRWLLLPAIVGEVAGVLEAARVIADKSSFRGSWSIGVGLRGVHGIAAYGENQGFQDGWKFSEDDYDESVEVDFERLRGPGGPVLDSLLGRLLRATKGSSDEISLMDPFGY